MKNRLIAILCLIATVTLFSGAAWGFKWNLFTENTNNGQSQQLPKLSKNNYLQLSTPQAGVSYPIYVYSGPSGSMKQIGFIPNSASPAILGEYTEGMGAIYSLYYENSGMWYGCTLTIQNGQLVSSGSQPCVGGVLNPPAINNIYGLGVGALAFPESSAAPSPAPVNPYNNPPLRTITFKNSTGYQSITISEQCTAANNPNLPSPTPKHQLGCPSNSPIATVDANNSVTFQIPNVGLNSANFYVSGYQPQSGNAVTTDVGSALLFEGTWSPVPYPGNEVTSNLDVSAVNGFNIGVSAYPETPAYCTYTIPNSSGISEIGYYDSIKPMASLALANNLTLQELCTQSSQTVTIDGTQVVLNLLQQDSDGNFQSCLNPCTYVTNQQLNQNIINTYCCINAYNTPATCNAQNPGASNSLFTTNLTKYTHAIYAYAYDDQVGDHACPGLTNFVVDFTTGATPPPPTNCTISMPTLEFDPSNCTTNGTTSSCAISWPVATLSGNCPQNPTINYGISVAQINGVSVFKGSTTNLSEQLNNLNESWQYNATITPSIGDNIGQDATAPFYVPTFDPPTFASPAVTDIESNQATINWNPPVEDTFVKKPTYQYAITVTPTAGGQSLSFSVSGINGQQQSKSVSGLSPSTNYSVVISASDPSGNVSPLSAPTTFSTTATPPQTCTITTGAITATPNGTSANITWPAATYAHCTGGAEGYTATLTPADGNTYSGEGTSWDVTGLSSGSYTVSVTATYVGCNGPANGVSYTPANFTITPPTPVFPAPVISACCSNGSCTVATVTWPSLSSVNSYSVSPQGSATCSTEECTATSYIRKGTPITVTANYTGGSATSNSVSASQMCDG